MAVAGVVTCAIHVEQAWRIARPPDHGLRISVRPARGMSPSTHDWPVVGQRRRRRLGVRQASVRGFSPDVGAHGGQVCPRSERSRARACVKYDARS